VQGVFLLLVCRLREGDLVLKRTGNNRVLPKPQLSSALPLRSLRLGGECSVFIYLFLLFQSAMSASTIIRTNCLNVTLGSQLSFFRAFVGSPINRSTSAGRK
jgi:hypothetical protein